jgi:hypothetical protein
VWLASAGLYLVVWILEVWSFIVMELGYRVLMEVSTDVNDGTTAELCGTDIVIGLDHK